MSTPHIESILECLPELIGYWDSMLVNQYANQAHMEWLDWPPEQIRGRHLLDVIPQFRDPARLELIQAALQGKPQTFDCDFSGNAPEGKRLAQVHCLPTETDGRVNGLYTLITDIGELQRTRYELHEAQRIGRMGSWIWHAGNNTVHWSPELPRLMGIIANSGAPGFASVARPLTKASRQALRQLMRDAAQTGAPQLQELACRRHGEELSWLIARAQPIMALDGSLLAIRGTVQDITEQKRVESELLASRNRLRSMVVHHEVACEEERKHLAREVHDELGQLLSAMRMDLALLGQHSQKNPQIDRLTQDMGSLVDRMFAVARGVVTSLRPAALDAGLVAAVEWLAQDFSQRSGIPCRIDAPQQDLILRDALASVVFRVIQESMTNVARHAQATEVRITLACTTDALTAQVSDNGIGFDHDAVQAQPGYGLLSIKERALSLGGASAIESKPGQGTTVWIHVPV